jgi:hypothetical protein
LNTDADRLDAIVSDSHRDIYYDKQKGGEFGGYTLSTEAIRLTDREMADATILGRSNSYADNPRAQAIVSFMSGVEFGVKTPDSPFESIREKIWKEALGNKLFDHSAFAYGYFRGQLEAHPEELKGRIVKATELRGGSDQSKEVRDEIARLESPIFDKKGKEKAGSSYARYGEQGFNTQHGLRGSDLATDPIVLHASAGTAGLLGGGMAAVGATTLRAVTRQAALGAGLGGGINGIEQGLHIYEGTHSFSLPELVTSAGLGALLTPVIGKVPSLAKFLTIFGFTGGYDALGEEAPLTAGFRATLALFGPKITRVWLLLDGTKSQSGEAVAT